MKLVSGKDRKRLFNRENSTVAITIFCIFCFELVARDLDDVSDNQLKFADAQ